MDKSLWNMLFRKYQSGKGFYGNVRVLLSLIGPIIPFAEIGMRSVKPGFWERLTLLEAMIGIVLFWGLKILPVWKAIQTARSLCPAGHDKRIYSTCLK